MAQLIRKYFKDLLGSDIAVARFSYHVSLIFFLILLVVAAFSALLKMDKVVGWAQELSIVCLILSGVLRSMSLSIFYVIKKEFIFAGCTLLVVIIFLVANIIYN